ncbi:response regulator [Maribacter chungangensis]|uniref:Response regulator n=1 Tax=Maribacter chungangensis TaxID=1069117 RepID=A0ABW3B5Q3_9FLAO
MKITHAILVDDDPILRYSIKKMINPYIQGTQFHAFACGYDALEYIQNMQLNDSNRVLILLDLNMPLLTGVEFLKQFTEKFKDKVNQFSIHILSSSSNPKERKELLNHTLVQGFISKPITMMELESLIA